MISDVPASSIWPPTDWDQVAAAGSQVGKEAEIPNELLVRYSKPLKIYLGCLLKPFRLPEDRSEDLLQDFVVDRVLKEGWLKKADPDRGRFRDFLKTSLRHFVRDYLRSRQVQNPPMPLEESENELACAEEASQALDWAWTREVVLDEALRRMEADCRDPAKEQPRRTQIWEVFRLRFLNPILEGAQPADYEELVKRFGFRSPSEAFNTLGSGKRMFKTHLIQVIAEYEGRDSRMAEEIRELEDFLARLARNRAHGSCKI